MRRRLLTVLVIVLLALLLALLFFFLQSGSGKVSYGHVSMASSEQTEGDAARSQQVKKSSSNSKGYTRSTNSSNSSWILLAVGKRNEEISTAIHI